MEYAHSVSTRFGHFSGMACVPASSENNIRKSRRDDGPCLPDVLLDEGWIGIHRKTRVLTATFKFSRRERVIRRMNLAILINRGQHDATRHNSARESHLEP